MKDELLARYARLIAVVASVDYTSREGIEQYRAKFLLTDGSTLRVSEVWIDGQLAKYGYFWLDEKDQLIGGWDNAPHHPEIQSHPHHLHVRTGVEPSDVTKLDDVLEFLSKRILK